MKKLRPILLILCLALLVYALYRYVSAQLETKAGADAYENLGTAQISPAPTASAQPSYSPPWDFARLLEAYPEMRAWLYCPDTPIDYPVMQGSDNSHYLTHLFDGTKNSMGSLFLDHASAPDFTDANTVIYGHNMKSDVMFSSLPQYKDQAYYDAHPLLYLFTPQGDYQVELLAGYVASGQTEQLPRSFEDDDEFIRYVNSLTANSTFQSPVQAAPGDRLVTFCTCTYDFKNARYILVGKLTPL